MKTGTKVWLMIAASLVLIGCIIFAEVMSMLKWDFSKLSTVQYQTNTYKISETFDSISITTDTANIVFAVSNDGTCKVECYEEEKAKHSVTVQDGTLVIKLTNNKHWYDHIGINIRSPKITVYLPETEYTTLLIREDTGDIAIPKDFSFQNVDISLSTGDVDLWASASETVKIKGSTGNIRVQNISAGSLEITVTTGKVTASGVNCAGNITVNVSTGKGNLTDICCKNLTSSGDTGDISLKNVIAQERFSIQRSTGDVTLDGCDAAEISVETDTGSVVGSLLTGKEFITETSTGKIDVPKTTTGGLCKIKTETGNIKITIKQS